MRVGGWAGCCARVGVGGEGGGGKEGRQYRTAHRELGHVGADLGDDAHHLVAGHHGPGGVAPIAANLVQVGVADAAATKKGGRAPQGRERSWPQQRVWPQRGSLHKLRRGTLHMAGCANCAARQPTLQAPPPGAPQTHTQGLTSG
jgi:hypothetical protein